RFSEDDYLRYVDGKPRYDGVRSFLESRAIALPEGTRNDSVDAETVCGIGNRKNAHFLRVLQEDGAEAYPTSVRLVEGLQERGIDTAVITSSRNAEEVLAGAGVRHLFSVKVDGVDSDDLGLAGKPMPDIFLEAVRRLGVDPGRAAVVEDALMGVEAGRSGGFALVIGVDRAGQAAELEAKGADLVVSDLGELLPGPSYVDQLPAALVGVSIPEGQRLAVFLDYDGTVTPIVPHPSQAVLSNATRSQLARLAAVCPVAVISGRDRADVESMVGLAGIHYAGSHGFDISRPDGGNEERGAEFRPALEAAADELEQRISTIDGSWVEQKRYAVAVHFRQSAEDAEELISSAAQEVASGHPELRLAGGKKIFELRPNMEWDKGLALLHLLGVMGLDGNDVTALYIGDDETDEDVFRILDEGRGIGIVVGTEHRETMADFALKDPDQVVEFLGLLAEREGG
ncbi:MAG TPA: trehalose-phosphatase, partial [Acidimicrobiia bacterium]|nr:trehalose-phosphatase [Acidimicrobiia bacterium]